MAMEEGESIGSLSAVDTASTYDRLPSLASAAASVSNQSTQAQQPSAQDIQDSLSQVNTKLAASGRVMQLNVDPSTGLTVATIRDAQSGNVLEQFPGTDSLRLAAMLDGWASGKNIQLDLIA
jgi:uncharacterized FlaG/YvyC family protein